MYESVHTQGALVVLADGVAHPGAVVVEPVHQHPTQLLPRRKPSQFKNNYFTEM